MSRFTVVVRVEVDDEPRRFVVSGRIAQYVPAVTSGPADNWRLAEGGELEDLSIAGPDGAEISEGLERRLKDDQDFLDAVRKEIEDERADD